MYLPHACFVSDANINDPDSAKLGVRVHAYCSRPNHLLTYLLTYLLTPWSRVLENLIGLQLVKKFPAFYGTRSFLTRALHLSLS